MLTDAALNKRMLFVFETVRMRYGHLKTAEAQVTPRHAEAAAITIPHGFDDDYTLRYVFHELLHIVLPGELGAFGQYEEDIIKRVLEPSLIRYVTDNGRRHARWLNNLKRIPRSRRARAPGTAPASG